MPNSPHAARHRTTPPFRRERAQRLDLRRGLRLRRDRPVHNIPPRTKRVAVIHTVANPYFPVPIGDPKFPEYVRIQLHRMQPPDPAFQRRARASSRACHRLRRRLARLHLAHHHAVLLNLHAAVPMTTNDHRVVAGMTPGPPGGAAR